MTDNKREELLLKAKPILFNTKMVRAILDGRKTVTRRIVKNNPEECTSKVVNGVCKICDDKGGFYLPDDYVKVRSPYQVGGILYVRETWYYETFYEDTDDITDLPFGNCSWRYVYKADRPNYPVIPDHWHPSIHMPKEAARIFLRVTDIRIERLHPMVLEDLEAEGLNTVCGLYVTTSNFADLWDSTIKKSDIDKYGWAANPFVWVIEFERVG